MANVFLRESTGWTLVGGFTQPTDPTDPTDPPPPPPDPTGTWEDAVATRSYAQVEAWYAANTGYGALGYTYADLTPGSLASTHDGQVIEGIRGGPIRIAHNNVTYRGCLVETWGTYGAYFNPTFGSTVVGSRIEHTTIAGPGGNPSTQIRGALFTSSRSSAVLLSRCNLHGWTSAASSGGGMSVEYSWLHNLASGEASGAHRTAMLSDGSDTHYTRNYCTDGGSSCISVYFDRGVMNNITIQENILNGSDPNASPSYLINTKAGTNGPTATNVKYLGNYFGHQYQFGIISVGNVAWGSNGNIRSGNQLFADGAPAGNS